MNSFAQAYGYFAARIKIPAGKGLWPAFWTLPQDGTWPPEIDILESVKPVPDRLYTTYHYKDTAGQHKSAGKETKTEDLSRDFHVYSVAWEPHVIRWYLDGREVFSTQQDVLNKPVYLLLNLAVGGHWPGQPGPETHFPATMEVDWVRVYTR